ncbi:5TMR of 5TMR-LYT [Methanolobus vulcani]|uniref:5TMR of 5TMR-LYT n=1 Tax=Methanolobus vulcani TaxID=38026 RepID=A0A7Z7AZX6_9EURY|nr:LytS/YhcK type 5TM receptor domain-containing protein [Methanolobus vulcani]SDG04350.1 5TMR of 5TMR-LYT [Methanolobus vulcani]
MNIEMLITLINNAALLILLGVFYDVLLSNNKINKHLRGTVLGFVVGLVGIALMLNPWEVFPGLFYDSRSILLSVVSLFFGFIPAVIGAIIMIVYRLYVGGIGSLLNIIAMIAFIAIGLSWRKYHEKLKKN